MIKEVLYRYQGTNGIITSPVHLEDVYYIRYLRLCADKGKILTNGQDRVQIVTIPESNLSEWKELDVS